MVKRRCILRAEPKGGRKRGRCLRWARPSTQKWSDAKRVFKLGEFDTVAKRRRSKKGKSRSHG